MQEVERGVGDAWITNSSGQGWRGEDGDFKSARDRLPTPSTVYTPHGFMCYCLLRGPGTFRIVVCNVIMFYTLGINRATSVALLFQISTAGSETKMQTGWKFHISSRRMTTGQSASTNLFSEISSSQRVSF